MSQLYVVLCVVYDDDIEEPQALRHMITLLYAAHGARSDIIKLRLLCRVTAVARL